MRAQPRNPKIINEPTSQPHEQLQQTNGVKHVATTVNFANVSDSFEPRGAGEYPATLHDFLINAASASSGQPTVRLEFNESDSNNKKIFRTYSLQEKALWSLKRDLVRLGADIEQMNAPDADLEDILASCRGYACTIVMGEPREYQKKDKTTGKLLFLPNGEPDMAKGDNFTEIKDPTKA